MNQRDEIVNAIAKAESFQAQASLVAALDAYDRDTLAAHATSRQVEMTDMIVGATLSPVAVHERSTIETDWLGEITASAEDIGPKVIAEAAAWYGRVSPEVKADREEFAEQAKGIARRTASAYGDQAAGAEASFLDYVTFLHRRQAASGLPQVQQLVDSHENPAQQPLPDEVFDTFGPPVHPINQGVSGTESSERAPLIQEIEGQGGQGSTETHHDTSQSFQGPAPVEARPGTQGTTASLETPLFTPTVGLSHTATLLDFLPGGRFHKEAASCGCPGADQGDGHLADCPIRGGGSSTTEYGVDPYDEYDDYHEGSKQAASGLPQVQQIVDAKDEKPATTPLPEEVAFPWLLEDGEQIDERSDHKAMRTQALAYLWGLTIQPTQTLTDVQRLQVAAYRKHADQWTQGQPQYHGPGTANSPFTTPEGISGTHAEGYAEGQSDWRNDEAPTFADDSSHVPPFVQGHSEGYGDAARSESGGAQEGQMPPGAGGFGSYQTHAASLTYSMPVVANMAVTSGQAICSNCGKSDAAYNMTVRGNGNTQSAWCSNCKPVSSTHGQGDSFTKAPATRTSSLFVTAVEMADPDFAKAYKYASKWAPGKPLVRRVASKVAFEAGLYAGISDNPANQDAWTNAHVAAATRYKDRGFTDRVALHGSFTQKVAKAMPSLRVNATYLAAPEKPAKPATTHHAKTDPDGTRLETRVAATSLDLDTASPSTSPSPTGQTPVNGPGEPPPLAGGTDPAAPGGPSPYNGAPPYGTPVVNTGPAAHGDPMAIATQPGAPVDAAAYEHLSPQTHAFRRTVQANLLAQHQS